MINRFYPPRNYQYYESIRHIPDKLIEECLLAAAATSQLILMKGVRHPFDEKNPNNTVSFIHFKRETLPFYLKEGKERDIQHGYCSIIEVEKYLLVSQHGADNFLAPISDYIRKIAAPSHRISSISRLWGNQQQTG